MQSMNVRKALLLFVILTLALAACTPAQTTAAPSNSTAVPAQPTTAAAQPTSAPAQPTAAPASTEPTVVNLVSDSDTNITDWLTNTVAPAFEAAYPQYRLNVTSVSGIGNGDADVADRAYAAMQANKGPQLDILEFDATSKPDLMDAGLWLKLDATNVPNSANLLEGVKTSDFSLPYRGSQVLLAYDSTKIADADVPQSFADLISWIKANPGQFVYCRPDKGGSGGNFVVRAIYEVTGKNPSIFKPGTPDPALVAEFSKAWDLLSEIHPNIYDNGAYPAGNTQSLTLLTNGAVSMTTAWSDQALQSLDNGILPDTVKLTQLKDLPFPGGNTSWSIPANAENPEGALAFLNFILSPEMQVSVIQELGGFPAVQWSTLPADLQEKFASVIPSSVPFWPGGEWESIRNQGWYENVATGMTPDSE